MTVSYLENVVQTVRRESRTIPPAIVSTAKTVGLFFTRAILFLPYVMYREIKTAFDTGEPPKTTIAPPPHAEYEPNEDPTKDPILKFAAYKGLAQTPELELKSTPSGVQFQLYDAIEALPCKHHASSTEEEDLPLTTAQNRAQAASQWYSEGLETDKIVARRAMRPCSTVNCVSEYVRTENERIHGISVKLGLTPKRIKGYLRETNNPDFAARAEIFTAADSARRWYSTAVSKQGPSEHLVRETLLHFRSQLPSGLTFAWREDAARVGLTESSLREQARKLEKLAGRIGESVETLANAERQQTYAAAPDSHTNAQA